jgi:hypothetical protein
MGGFKAEAAKHWWYMEVYLKLFMFQSLSLATTLIKLSE